MNAEQSSQLAMFRGVRDSSNEFRTAWNSFPAFADHFVVLTANIAKIEALAALQETDTTGAAEEKKSKRLDMIPGLLKLAAVLRLLGDKLGDSEIGKQGQVTKTDLEAATGDAFVGKAKRLLQAINTHTTTLILAEYRLTATEVSTLSTQLDDYVNYIGVPRARQDETQRATLELAQVFAETNELLDKRLDPAVVLLTDEAPSFVLQYGLSRAIEDPSYNTRALQVQITDATTGMAIEAAAATINPGGIEKLTTANGGFYVNSLAAGDYTMHISRAGFATKEVPFAVTAGIRTDLAVTLSEVGAG